jgi:hypothetical protein
VAATAGPTAGSCSVNWAAPQQEGMTLCRGTSSGMLCNRPAWRRLLGPWGAWYLYKAQPVSVLM